MSTEDDRVRIRIAEIMSSAGVGYNQIALEILYLLPSDFINNYIRMWERAFGPAVRAPGDQMLRDGELGKAPTQTARKGQMVGAGSGGSAKRWKRIVSIRDERALRLKDRVDKRLRGISRDMRDELSLMESKAGRRGGVEVVGSSEVVTQCKKCGKIQAEGWAFCPYDGSPNRPESDRVG